MLRKLKMVMMIPCVLAAGLVVYVIVNYELDQRKHWLVVDNSLDQPLVVELDGQVLGNLQSVNSPACRKMYPADEEKCARAFEVPAGKHQLVARSLDKKEIETVALAVPEDPLFRAIWCVGGKHRYAVATLFYFTSEADDSVMEDEKYQPQLEILAAPDPLVSLPADSDTTLFEHIDQRFSEEQSTYSSEDAFAVTRLCRVLPADDGIQVGCEGFGLATLSEELEPDFFLD